MTNTWTGGRERERKKEGEKRVFGAIEGNKKNMLTNGGWGGHLQQSKNEKRPCNQSRLILLQFNCAPSKLPAVRVSVEEVIELASHSLNAGRHSCRVCVYSCAGFSKSQIIVSARRVCRAADPTTQPGSQGRTGGSGR